MRAVEPEVTDIIWRAVEPLLPAAVASHPLGCHRPRVPNRLCFRGILIRLVTGASWVDIEAILDHQVSDTTLRARRDEWIDAGCSRPSRPKPSRRSTGSSGSISTMLPWTGRCTKPRMAARAPAPTPPIEASWVGSGPSRRNATASPSRGSSTAPTATTWPCSPHPRRPRRHRPARRDRHPAPRPRLRLRRRAGPPPCRRDRPGRDPTPRHHGARRQETTGPARAALDRRSHQHLVVELRATPPQHRPTTPPRGALPRHHHPHHRPPPRLAKQMEPNLTPIGDLT
jgi:transposase